MSNPSSAMEVSSTYDLSSASVSSSAFYGASSAVPAFSSSVPFSAAQQRRTKDEEAFDFRASSRSNTPMVEDESATSGGEDGGATTGDEDAPARLRSRVRRPGNSDDSKDMAIDSSASSALSSSSSSAPPSSMSSRDPEKEVWYAQRFTHLAKEIEQMMCGLHPEFIKQTKTLETARERRILAAERSRQLQIQQLNNIFEAEKKQAFDEFEHEKSSLRERLLNLIMDQQKQLEDERNNVSIYGGHGARGVSTRKLRGRRGGAAAGAEAAGGSGSAAIPGFPQNATTLHVANTAYSTFSNFTYYVGGGASSSSSSGQQGKDGVAIGPVMSSNAVPAAVFSKKRLPTLTINKTLAPEEIEADLLALSQNRKQPGVARAKA